MHLLRPLVAVVLTVVTLIAHAPGARAGVIILAGDSNLMSAAVPACTLPLNVNNRTFFLNLLGAGPR